MITAKHHDGFATFDSRVNAFNIVAATPFKRDPLKELAEECRRQGIKLGVLLLSGPGLDGSWGERDFAGRSRSRDAPLG